jgi:hypothetical protein
MLDTFQPSAVFTTIWFIRKRVGRAFLASRRDHECYRHVELRNPGLQLNYLEFIYFGVERLECTPKERLG